MINNAISKPHRVEAVASAAAGREAVNSSGLFIQRAGFQTLTPLAGIVAVSAQQLYATPAFVNAEAGDQDIEPGYRFTADDAVALVDRLRTALPKNIVDVELDPDA